MIVIIEWKWHQPHFEGPILASLKFQIEWFERESNSLKTIPAKPLFWINEELLAARQ
jgi:lipid-A-disaccharide synthase-like uncharacterized protein